MSVAMNDISVSVVPMPVKLRAYTVYTDDHYTIIINDRLSPDGRMRAYKHELFHIMNGDFEGGEPTGLIEIRAHAST